MRRLAGVCFAFASVACAPKSDAPDEAPKRDGAAKQAANDAKTPGEAKAPSDAAPSEPLGDDTPSAEAPPEEAGPIEIPSDAPVVPIVDVAAAAMDVEWREVSRPTEAVTFEPVTSGVIGRAASGWLDVDKAGALVMRPEIQAAKGPILGSWPDNAWVVETRTVNSDDRANPQKVQYRLMRLRGNKRWVPQMYEGEQRFESAGETFAIGGKGGLIVQKGCMPYDGDAEPGCKEGLLTRISDRGTDPELGLDVGGELVGFFETKSGKLYTARRRDGEVIVQTDCVDRGCVAAQATKMPLGKDWFISRPLARQRNSVTALAEIYDGAPKKFLLHYEAGGWKLDGIAEVPTGLWPTAEGGLWSMIGGKLMHRDANGVWNEVAPPSGASSVSAAVHGSELWIAAQVDGAPVVFATAASVAGIGGAPVPTPTPEPTTAAADAVEATPEANAPEEAAPEDAPPKAAAPADELPAVDDPEAEEPAPESP